MNEKEAREIVESVERRSHLGGPKTAHIYKEARGFLAGLEAERDRIRPLIERLTFLANALPPNAISMHISKALDAYTTSRSDGKKYPAGFCKEPDCKGH